MSRRRRANRRHPTVLPVFEPVPRKRVSTLTDYLRVPAFVPVAHDDATVGRNTAGVDLGHVAASAELPASSSAGPSMSRVPSASSPSMTASAAAADDGVHELGGVMFLHAPPFLFGELATARDGDGIAPASDDALQHDDAAEQQFQLAPPSKRARPAPDERGADLGPPPANDAPVPRHATGLVGKLEFHRSGRMFLISGDRRFRVVPGDRPSCAETVVAMVPPAVSAAADDSSGQRQRDTIIYPLGLDIGRHFYAFPVN